MNDLSKKQIDVLLEEYKTLRQESLNTINNRVSVMGFSFASLSIIASVTVSAKVPAGIVALILAFVVPILAKTVSHVWIGEYERSQRAGDFIADLENTVNACLGGQKLLSWENMLREKESNKLNVPYRSTIRLLHIYWICERGILFILLFIGFTRPYIDNIRSAFPCAS